MAPAPRWARELKASLAAEVAALEAGQRKTFDKQNGEMVDTTGETLRKMRLQLIQVESLITSFEQWDRSRN
jgi:hypothetical protein